MVVVYLILKLYKYWPINYLLEQKWYLFSLSVLKQNDTLLLISGSADSNIYWYIYQHISTGTFRYCYLFMCVINIIIKHNY